MNMDMQELIEEMSALIVKIKNGSATQGELEAFAAAASQLHERAIVLRYKAYEAKVFGMPVTQPVAVKEEPAMDLPETETTEEYIPVEEIPETVTPTEAVETEEISFDLFGEPEATAESVDLFETEAADVPEMEEPVLETPEVEPVKELAIEEAPEPELSFEEPLAEMPQEKPITEEPIIPVSQPSSPSNATSGTHPIYKRLVTDDNSLAARLMAVKLETLKGAFGFNERLQIISELFDGSSEQFNHAIEVLDTLASKEEARQMVSSIAYRFSWDKESDAGLEFIQKIERRYA